MKALKIQDFISIGIYTAIYFLIILVAMIILQLVLPGYSFILIPGVTALFSGIIYLLMLQKIPKLGAITIMSSVIGLFFLLSGYSIIAFIPSILCGLAADVLQHRTSLPLKLKTHLSYMIFSFGLIGPTLPLWFMKNSYIDSLTARGKDSDYISRVFEHISMSSFAFCVLSIIVLSVIGLAIGQRLYQKHFSEEKDTLS